MDGSAFQHQLAGVHADYLFSAEAFPQNAQGAVVIPGLVEHGNDDGFIHDEEIGVTGRELVQPPVLRMEGVRHREGNHLHAGTVHAPQILQAFIIFRQGAVMGGG